MIDNEFIKEYDKLDGSATIFATFMKNELFKKARLGWRGWDNPKSLENLLNIVVNKAAQLQNGEDQSVDLANYCMMIYFLTHNDKQEFKPPDA